MFWDTPSIPALYGSIIPFLVLDVVVIILRFVARRRLGQKPQVDDWLMIPAFIGVIALAGMYFWGLASKSLGYRYMLLPPPGVDMMSPDFVPEFAGPESRIVATRRLEYSSLIIYTAVAGLIKISVLIFYRRIFTVTQSRKDWRNWFFIAMIVVITAWALSWIFAFVFMCRRNVQTLFTSPENLAANCVDTLAVGYGHSVSDFITDALIIVIPIPFVWKLHLPTGRKLAVCGVFLLGSLAAGSSLVRMAWMTWNQEVGFGMETDEELMITTELYWMMLAIILGVLAACLPTLRGLFRTKSVESMAKSMRTVFSLGSTSWSGSRKGTRGDSMDESLRSKESTTGKVNSQHTVVEV
ncbi:hypothetical protein BU23DRAFT_507193 [Bimuria novae-zelandiae CBS 107.79]|uniref:Rhodopsin domain-containing protein n=1 Tax=Bimuria novae-zelandiae CBS 107.79 TaxID=1447943 RepID=A0A6A5V7T6_9PLEO|nr:hypothetical protein BU23DRAFT_507193 [Bimuria novae-zelandiae CBS 107.79]